MAHALLSGLYDPTAGSPRILLRADGNRWTLIHESFHHLFAKSRRSEESASVLLAKLTEARLKLVAIEAKGLNSEADARTYLNLTSEVIRLAGLHVNQTALEEVAIEANLQELFESGELKYVPNKLSSSGRYIADNSVAAKETYVKLVSKFEQARATVTSLGFSRTTSGVWDWSKSLSGRIDEIGAVVKKYGSRQESGGGSAPSLWSGEAAIAQPARQLPCSTSIDRMIEAELNGFLNGFTRPSRSSLEFF